MITRNPPIIEYQLIQLKLIMKMITTKFESKMFSTRKKWQM